MWDVLSYDFKKSIKSSILQRNVLDNIENGSIIVFHDNKKSEKILKKKLKEILKKIREKDMSSKLCKRYKNNLNNYHLYPL